MYIYEYGLMQFATAASEPNVWVGYVTTGGASYSHALSFTNLILKMDKNVETNGNTVVYFFSTIQNKSNSKLISPTAVLSVNIT